jgi:hypothetical protein
VIERLEDMPDGVLGFRFSGEVSRGDYDEVLIPVLREAIEGREGLRCLCQVGPGFEGYEMGAIWEDMMTGAEYGIGHRSAWKRMALVTDIEWIRHLTALFGWMAPGELKLFSLDELGAAKEWVGE